MTARRFAAVWVALAIVAWLGFTLGLRRLALPDEGRYVGVAWEMLRSGDWLVPALDGLPFFHKPPLFYWITGASLAAFGPVTWAARLAPLAGAVIAALSLYLLVRRWLDGRVAAWATAVLVTQPLFFVGAQFANLDMLVAGCITATIAFTAHAALCLDTGEADHRPPLLAAHASAALGVLAKGLIGMLLPGLVLVIWLVLAQRPRLLLRLVSLPGWLVFAIIAAPWFVAMQQRFDDFANYFFVYQHWHRYTLGSFNNAQPFWFPAAGIALLTLPWFPGLWAAWRARPTDRKGPDQLLRLLMWVWLVVIVVFFSIPRSKLIGYVAPALPPLAALVADGVWRLSNDATRTARRLCAVAAFAALVCVGGVIGNRFIDTRSTDTLARLLEQRRAEGDAVVFISAYYYDVPFHARLREPVQVVEAWTAIDIAARDNWRKELFDAARFAPEADRAVLVDRADFARRLCEREVTWVFAPPGTDARYPVLRTVPPLARTDRAVLWRLERAAVCVNGNEKPNDGLPGS